MNACRLLYVDWEARYSWLPESMLTYPYGERLCAWRDRTILSAGKTYKNVGEDMCSSRRQAMNTSPRNGWSLLASGFCTMTMLAHIKHESCRNTWKNTGSRPWSNPPPLQPRSSLVRFLVVLNHEMCFTLRVVYNECAGCQPYSCHSE